MNSKKIAFISCVNDDATYKECLRFIDALEIPEGYSIEKIAIKNARSITSGYNEGMKKTDAKYKIYIHQDTYIINRKILFDILEIFKDDNVGLIGAAGALTIPPNGMWWNSLDTEGSIYHNPNGNGMEIYGKNIGVDKVINVQAIDGLIMITQKDVKWREDLFDGWHFYDVSQSVEFLKLGYEIKVIKKVEPWIIHDCGTIWVNNDDIYNKYRAIFLKEYSDFLFPLVSIIITAYNRPKYFIEALESAINQSYIKKEIVIIDNSTNDEVMKVMDNYKNYDYIRYYKNEKELKVIENFNKGIKLAKSNYVTLLMDDDILYEDKLTEMMKYFIGDNNISLVTSKRTCIDRNGSVIRDRSETTRITLDPIYLNDKFVKEYYEVNLLNLIGETSVPIFRKDLLKGSFGEYRGRSYEVISDFVTWISLLEKGRGVYIEQPLSYFRNYPDQDQRKVYTKAKGIIEIIFLLETFLIEEKNVMTKGIFEKVINNMIVYKKIVKENNLDLDERLFNEIIENLEKIQIDIKLPSIDPIIKKIKLI